MVGLSGPGRVARLEIMSPEKDSHSRENDGSEDSAGRVFRESSRLKREENSGSEEHSREAPPGRPENQSRSRPSNGRYSASRLGKQVRSVGTLGMIPILLGVGPIIGLFIGRWLDKQFGSSPWLTALFVIMGFVAAVREMLQLLRRYSDEDNKSDKYNKYTSNKDTRSNKDTQNRAN